MDEGGARANKVERAASSNKPHSFHLSTSIDASQQKRRFNLSKTENKRESLTQIQGRTDISEGLVVVPAAQREMNLSKAQYLDMGSPSREPRATFSPPAFVEASIIFSGSLPASTGDEVNASL